MAEKENPVVYNVENVKARYSPTSPNIKYPVKLAAILLMKLMPILVHLHGKMAPLRVLQTNPYSISLHQSSWKLAFRCSNSQHLSTYLLYYGRWDARCGRQFTIHLRLFRRYFPHQWPRFIPPIKTNPKIRCLGRWSREPYLSHFTPGDSGSRGVEFFCEYSAREDRQGRKSGEVYSADVW